MLVLEQVQCVTYYILNEMTIMKVQTTHKRLQMDRSDCSKSIVILLLQEM